MASIPLVREGVAPQPSAAAVVAPPRDMQELWFATRRREWNTLCVVPAAPGLSALPVAEALAKVGQLIRGHPVRVINAEGVDLSQIAQLAAEMTGQAKPSTVWTSVASRRPSAVPDGSPVIIALESVVGNPLALPVALVADAILLCVELGQTGVENARHTIHLLGRERLLGTVLVRPAR
jgi:hypothetical protein